MREGDRLMTICNSCRYCEGYCAVFPAMERRLEFPDDDLNYLANLCHNCTDCLYACQYAPPHEFAVDVPKILAEIRRESYRQYARPIGLLSGTTVAALVIVLAALGLIFTPRTAGGDFYAAIPHSVMVAVFGAAGLLVVAAWAVALGRLWQDQGAAVKPRFSALGDMLRDVTRLKYLSSPARRVFHHLTFYGFLLCFASTCVAAFYDNALGWKAPYAYSSVPVVLGTLGGIGLVIGPLGLLRWRQKEIGTSFIALLLATSTSGLLLLIFRGTHAMSPLLGLHLAIVLALFVTLPYGKFVHGIYRSAALFRYALEQQGGNESQHGGDR
jgi:citrate/tricarballylate utilization protein